MLDHADINELNKPRPAPAPDPEQARREQAAIDQAKRTIV